MKDRETHKRIDRDRYKRLIILLTSIVNIAAQTGVFAFIWLTHFKDDGANYFVRGNTAILMLYAVISYLVCHLMGGFKVGYFRIIEVLFSNIASIICVNFITYIQLCLICRWQFLTSRISYFLFLTFVDFIIVSVWVILTRAFYVKIYPPRKMLVVHGKYDPRDVVRKINSREDKYNIQQLISYEEGIDVIEEKILDYNCIILMDIPSGIRNKLLKFAFEKNIRCYCVPKISDIMITSASNVELFDTSLLLMRNQGIAADEQFIKRAVDVVGSILALIILSPIMLIIAICIKLYDGGPVIFTQERLTQGGKVFKIRKFRSMRVQNEQKDYCLTRKDDDRVTPVGKVIRALHLDELPQLINILVGDMSFVGPRPECPKLAKEYSEVVPEFNFRLKVKAGLTGYAQVFGKYNTTPLDKLKLDLTYIEKYNLLLDLKILLLTIKILFQKENTEGIDAWQTTAIKNNTLDDDKKISITDVIDEEENKDADSK